MCSSPHGKTVAGEEGDRNDNGHDDSDNHSDDKNSGSNKEEEEEARSTPVTVLADVYLAETIGTYFCNTTRFLQVGTDLYDYADWKVSPSDIAEEIKVPHFEDLIDKFL